MNSSIPTLEVEILARDLLSYLIDTYRHIFYERGRRRQLLR